MPPPSRWRRLSRIGRAAMLLGGYLLVITLVWMILTMVPLRFLAAIVIVAIVGTMTMLAWLVAE